MVNGRAFRLDSSRLRGRYFLSSSICGYKHGCYHCEMNYAMALSAPTWLPVSGPILIVLLLWSVFWKGLALWHSAQRGHYWWFVILLVVNTVGILEIIYLFAIAKLKFSTLFSSKR